MEYCHSIDEWNMDFMEWEKRAHCSSIPSEHNGFHILSLFTSPEMAGASENNTMAMADASENNMMATVGSSENNTMAMVGALENNTMATAGASENIIQWR